MQVLLCSSWHQREHNTFTLKVTAVVATKIEYYTTNLFINKHTFTDRNVSHGGSETHYNYSWTKREETHPFFLTYVKATMKEPDLIRES